MSIAIGTSGELGRVGAKFLAGEEVESVAKKGPYAKLAGTVEQVGLAGKLGSRAYKIRLHDGRIWIAMEAWLRAS